MKNIVRQAVTPCGFPSLLAAGKTYGQKIAKLRRKKVPVCLVGGHKRAIIGANIILTNVFKIQQIKSVLTKQDKGSTIFLLSQEWRCKVVR